LSVTDEVATRPATGSVGARSADPDRPRARVRRRLLGTDRETVLVRIAQLVVLVTFFGIWQVVSGQPGDRWVLIDEYYVSRPSDAFAEIQEWWTEGVLWNHVWVTLQETLVGWFIGGVGGMLVGFALGIGRIASRILNPFVMAVYAIPKLALAPLFLLWFGLGMQSKVAFVAAVVFFLIFFNTYSGVREVSVDQLDQLRIMGASSLQAHLRVTVPSAMTWVIAGLHVTVPYAFVGAVVGEMIAANRGLGYLVQRASQSFNTAELVGAVIVLVLLALVLNGVVSAFERFLLRWRTVGRGTVSGLMVDRA
jgi:NitT/TauT family transport system permease protein